MPQAPLNASAWAAVIGEPIMWGEHGGPRASPSAAVGRASEVEQDAEELAPSRTAPVAAGSFADHAAGAISATSTLAEMGYGSRVISKA